ncbi:MAG: phosphatase PAP2 family protein [Chlorobiaceae bacterium]|nr:phosphatase PAP2 family protein [Chlorobiaceae bacterium]
MHVRITVWPYLLLTLLLCAAAWFFADIGLARYFHQFRWASWMGIWDAITLAGQSEWYLVGGLAMFLGFRKRNRRASLAGLFIFMSVAVSGLAADLLKLLLGRARPMLLFDPGTFGFGGFRFGYEWNSFPSGHSATALSVAVALSLLQPRYRLPFLAAGVLIAASRVVLCHHYLSDVLAGSMLGAATAMLLYQRLFTSKFDETRSA